MNYIVVLPISIIILGAIFCVYIIIRLYPKSYLWNVPEPLNRMWPFSWMGWNPVKKYGGKIILIFLLLLIISIVWARISSRDKNNYVELNQILTHKEQYVGKVIYISGDIVKTPGFNVYYILVNRKMIDENVHPFQGLDVHYEGDIEKFILYDYPDANQNKYIKRDRAPLGVLLRGTLIDRGDITDAARYSFKIFDIEELQIIN